MTQHSTAHRLLFVCLGNICRSPMAEAIMYDLVSAAGLTHHYVLDSAGTYGGHAGELPDLRMREAALQRGYTLTHRSRPVRAADFDDFDLLIAMDDAVYDTLRAQATTLAQADKVMRMVQYMPQTQATHIPDPYYGGVQGFAHVIDLLEEGCEGLLRTLTTR